MSSTLKQQLQQKLTRQEAAVKQTKEQLDWVEQIEKQKTATK